MSRQKAFIVGESVTHYFGQSGRIKCSIIDCSGKQHIKRCIPYAFYATYQRSVDMDTNLMDTGVHVHVTDMDVDMDTRFLKTVTRTWTWTRGPLFSPRTVDLCLKDRPLSSVTVHLAQMTVHFGLHFTILRT